MKDADFRAALHKGLGRAHVVLQERDPEPYRAVLLDACLRNPVYDRQCAGARTVYFAALIALFPDPEWFESRILDALADDDDDDLDTSQLIEFALMFALRGSRRARQLMYERVGELALEGETLGAHELIELDGIDGFLFVAQRLGEAFAADPDLWDDDGLLKYLEERVDPEAVTAALERARFDRPFVGVYLDAVARTTERRSNNRRNSLELSGMPYITVKQSIQTGTPRHFFSTLRRWGRDAPDDAFLAAAGDLISETDPGRLAAYASIFTLRSFLLGPQPLIPLAWHADEWVSFRAIQALALLHDPAVRGLALELVGARQQLAYVVELLRLNYEPGDELWLLELVRGTHDEDDLHRIGQDMSDVFAERLVPGAAPIFLDLYERGPCQLCRRDFVRRLVELDAVPDWMAVESAHDADDETRAEIADYTASKE